MSQRPPGLSELQGTARDQDMSGVQSQPRAEKGESLEEPGHGEASWRLSGCQELDLTVNDYYLIRLELLDCFL